MNTRLETLPPMVLALQANFGSIECWRSEFVAMCSGQKAPAGRVRLDFVPSQGSLVNRTLADTAHSGIDGEPLLEVDPSEGLDAEAWIEAIDWAPAYQRYQLAVDAASEPYGAGADALPGAMVLDVRRSGVFEQALTVLPGARWRDPATVSHWARELPADQEIVVYCVYGHEVGRATALRLRAQGLKARYLQGGIDGWQAAGRPLDAKQGAVPATFSPASLSGNARPRSG